MNTVKAIINPKLLDWAVNCTNMPILDLANSAGVNEQTIEFWMNGERLPTVKQLRTVAKKLKMPFAVFYLQSPPNIKLPKFKDFRCLQSAIEMSYSSNLIFEIIESLERREILIELNKALATKALDFHYHINQNDSIKGNSAYMRELLKLTISEQKEIKDTRKLFNLLRSKLEDIGVLVFQASSVEVKEMRGMAITNFTLPIIIINRKDSLTAKVFTLIHEFTHILLRTSSICDINDSISPNDYYSNDEIFCNKIAGSMLVPRDSLINENAIKYSTNKIWAENILKSLSKSYCVSREVILRRLLDLNLTTKEFYELKRKEYQKELLTIPKRKSSFIPPVVNVLSKSGKLYISTVLNAYNSKLINGNALADYTGIKLKHYNALLEGVNK